MATYDPKFDLDRNGRVDQVDVGIFQRYFGTSVDTTDPVSIQCDFNGDDIIDEIDLSALMAHVPSSTLRGRITFFLPTMPWIGPPFPTGLAIKWPWA